MTAIVIILVLVCVALVTDIYRLDRRVECLAKVITEVNCDEQQNISTILDVMVKYNQLQANRICDLRESLIALIDVTRLSKGVQHEDTQKDSASVPGIYDHTGS